MIRRNQIDNDLLRIARMLDLRNEDILHLFNNRKEQISLSIGPIWYPGTKYGTISPDDF